MKNVSYYAAPALYKKPGKRKENIILTICQMYEVEFSELVDKKRTSKLVFVRHLTMYALKEKTKLTLKEIGNIFERDHTSVLHAVRMIENYIETDSYGKRKEITELIQLL